MQPETDNPIAAFLRNQKIIVLDGGLATTLEALGYELNDDLWSARILLEAPDAIRQVHLDFLDAGADCIVTSNYQASFPGFHKRGLDDNAAGRIMRLAVDLAVDARDEFWSQPAKRKNRIRPLVAASVGPYGAYLADGSEFVGRYGVGDEVLRDFHEKRLRLLAQSRADLLACETIPSRQEADVLLKLIGETPSGWSWVSFSCSDEKHLCDGSRIEDVAKDCDAEPFVAAVGINCTSPKYVPSLIAEARRGTGKPIIVYPNSGERYESEQKKWAGADAPVDLSGAALEWVRLGASGVGGCCRVGPDDILKIRQQLIVNE